MNVDSFLGGIFMPKVSREYLNEKKNRIIKSYYNIALTKTLSTITMQDVINESRLSQGGIYLFFKDVDEILSSVLNYVRQLNRVDLEIDPIIDNSSNYVDLINYVFEALGRNMEKNLATFYKLDFEFRLFATNYPERAFKVLNNATSEGHLSHIENKLRNRLLKFGISDIKVKEAFDYINTMYLGILMHGLMSKCYQDTEYSIMNQFRLMATTTISFVNS